MTRAAGSCRCAALLAALVPIAAIAGALPVPIDSLTPGVVATTDEAVVCGRAADGLTYSREHRHTSIEMKGEVLRSYGVEGIFRGEIDHRLPLALGGADDVRNLWPEPEPGFRVKDKLEDRVWHLVCGQHAMPLAAAQRLFLAPQDWRDSYRQVFGSEP